MALKSKNTSVGFVEIRQHSDTWYGLYVNGSLRQQSPDLSFILKEYNNIN